jgi:hypothetical protein
MNRSFILQGAAKPPVLDPLYDEFIEPLRIAYLAKDSEYNPLGFTIWIHTQIRLRNPEIPVLFPNL